MIRVFVNERPVSVAPGARVRDAVEQLDRDLAELVGRGAAYVTDGVGRPVDAGDPVGEGGAIFRVVVSARQGPPRLSKELLRRRPALTRAQAIEAPLAGIKRGEAETGTKVGVIVCGIRTRPPAESLELARAAAEYRTAGVVGFDLAGPERGYPARDHARAFAYAAQHGMACTCHAGEGDGPDSIRQALHDCGARRIGHGTRLGEDGPLLDYVVEHRVALEVCLTSNLLTHTVPSLAEHPFKRYLDGGVVVTLNTDGRLVDGVSLTDEYFLAQTQGGLAHEDLARVVLNACESAFLPEFEKVALVSRVQSELEAL